MLSMWKRMMAGCLSLLLMACGACPAFAQTEAEMPVPFGTASANAPYYAKPCNERLASLPEALMRMAEDGYSWEYEYVADKPAYALTLMDYANIYSFIHTHELDQDALREALSDADRMVHRKAFTPEEIDLLLGDDQAAAMAHFASPGTIVMGEKGYSVKWLYDHTTREWAAEGITPEMVIAVQAHYYNPLFTREAAKAFSRKLYDYTGVLTPVRLGQWDAGEVKPDGSVEEAEDGGVMLDVIEFCQYPDYPTGCESVSLYMLLNYYGVDVTVDQIYDLLPMGAQPYDDDEGVRHGANPEREFVGDPRSEYSYGVFNEPIARVAEQFMPGVETRTGASIDDIKAILDTGNPVLAWYVSAPMRDIMYRWSWLDENGETVYWPGGEHAVVICGYDEDSLTYRDPNAGTTVVIDCDTFRKSFDELGGRIVYYARPNSRSLSLAGVGNARELGGYTGADGRAVKRGVLLRTARLADATQEDVERLLSVYHLAVDVDFRGDGEVEKAPDPEMEGVEYLNIHILDDSAGPSEEMEAEIAALEEQGVEIDKITRLRLFQKYGGFTDQMYVDFLSSDVGKAGYTRFFRALLDLPEDRALLFHCSQGKDRTGCGAMLILFALGVDEETVMADFLLTNEYNAALIAEERAYLTENGIGEDELDTFMKMMDQVYPEFMENAIQWMTETYGSPLGYITRELGMTEADIQALRDKFLE